MTPDEYYGALADAGEGITATEGALRRLASRSPNVIEREEALAAADTLSATRRRLRALVAAERGAAPQRGALDRITVGPLEIDRKGMRVRLDGRPLRLNRKEYLLLCQLASDPTRTWTKATLLADVFGYPAGCKTRTVDAHVCRVRRHLPKGWVQNVWGVGYRLLSEEEVAAHGC
jgi:DNA-binding response OmpR family regulator